MPISSNINRISASHSGLKCVNLNVMSIVSKMDALRRMADDTYNWNNRNVDKTRHGRC